MNRQNVCEISVFPVNDNLPEGEEALLRASLALEKSAGIYYTAAILAGTLAAFMALMKDEGRRAGLLKMLE